MTSAQKLLSNPGVKCSGYLSQKISTIFHGTWKKRYIIILGGYLYIYDNSESINYSAYGILAAFYGVKVVKNELKPPFWIFVLKPILPTVKPLTFSASCENEMLEWIGKFKENISYSFQIYFQPMLIPTEKSKNECIETKRSDLPPVPSTHMSNKYLIKQRTASENNLVVGKLNAHKEKTPFKTISVEIPKSSSHDDYETITNFYDSETSSCASTSTFKSKNDLNLESYSLFVGTREEAFDEINKYFAPGCFLVRREGSKQVLTVKFGKMVRKYIITEDNTTKKLFISKKKPFNNLSELLSHYTENYLPDNWTLNMPYKLFKND